MMALVCGNVTEKMKKSVSKYLDTEPVNTERTFFSNGEFYVQLNESVRGKNVYFLHTLGSPVNDNLAETLITLDAIRRSSPNSISLILLHLGYSRQDRQVYPRSPISSRVIADCIQNAGAEKVITIDIHSTQITGFYTIPLENLFMTDFFCERIPKMENMSIVAPDSGGVKRARHFSNFYDAPVSIMDKRRSKGEVKTSLIGDVKDKNCLIVDDMIDTAGTLVESVDRLVEEGAKSVSVVATHGIFSSDALNKMVTSPIKQVYTTNIIPHSNLPKNLFTVFDISRFIAKAIKRHYRNASISASNRSIE